MTKAYDSAVKAPVAITEIKTVNGQSLVGSGTIQLDKAVVGPSPQLHYNDSSSSQSVLH